MLTALQKEQRMKGVGGSDAGVVAGVSPFKSPLQLYYEKRGEVAPSEEETEAMEWGNLLEEPIAQKYATKTGRQIRRQPLKVSTVHAFMLCNLDRQIIKDPRGPGVLECKALNAFTKIETVADLPDYIYLQGQHNMEVYGYDWMSFAILIGGQRFVSFDMERDQATIDLLVTIEAEFWRRVELGDPPPIDGSDATKELAKKLWPRDSGKVIALTSDDALATIHELERATQDLEKAEDRKTAMENWLKFRMQDASICKIHGFGEVTWKSAKTSKEEVCDLEKLKAEFPDAFAACVTKKEKGGGRRFLVKPEKGLVTL